MKTSDAVGWSVGIIGSAAMFAVLMALPEEPITSSDIATARQNAVTRLENAIDTNSSNTLTGESSNVQDVECVATGRSNFYLCSFRDMGEISPSVHTVEVEGDAWQTAWTGIEGSVRDYTPEQHDLILTNPEAFRNW